MLRMGSAGPKPNGGQIGPYTLIRKLGHGGFGVVWLAENRTILATTKVALKIPLNDGIELETIKHDATLWVQASGHTNVLPIIEANVYDKYAVIVSEFAPDGSLEAKLKRYGGKTPSIELALAIMAGILAGVEYLHSKNIIHRDLKPANILFQGETPRLTDFGISRVLKTTTHSGIAFGTPAYMSPEAIEGGRNAQTDIWSLGVIFYELVAGCLPFPQTDKIGLMYAILNDNPAPLPSSIPRQIQEIITCALQRNPTLRYKSAAEMRKALLEASRLKPHDGEQAKTLPWPPPTVPSQTYKTSTVKPAERIRLTSANPKTSITGGTIVTVKGYGLQDINEVYVDGTPVKFTIISKNELRITMPPHAAGNADVVIYNGVNVQTFSVQYKPDNLDLNREVLLSPPVKTLSSSPTKNCPTCKRTYADARITFCIIDGSPLTGGGGVISPLAQMPFKVGDIVEQYRYFDGQTFQEGQIDRYTGTKWRVKNISDKYVALELVSGRFLDNDLCRPGWSELINQSEVYKRVFPATKGNQRAFDQFRKVDPSLPRPKTLNARRLAGIKKIESGYYVDTGHGRGYCTNTLFGAIFCWFTETDTGQTIGILMMLILFGLFILILYLYVRR